MSWSLLVSPLHTLAHNAGWDWAAGVAFAYGLPDQPPPARELPTVRQILSAFRQANCHGVAWFRISGRNPSMDLPPCPDPPKCAEVDGLDLGEVSLQTDDEDDLQLDTRVTTIVFRKPSGRAVLAAMLALASQAGPLLVFDDTADKLIVVSTDDDESRMAEHWPW